MYTTTFEGYAKHYKMYLESAWQYTAADGNCAANTPSTAPYDFKTTGKSCPASKSETALKAAIAEQPVSVAIQANQFAFQTY